MLRGHTLSYQDTSGSRSLQGILEVCQADQYCLLCSDGPAALLWAGVEVHIEQQADITAVALSSGPLTMLKPQGPSKCHQHMLGKWQLELSGRADLPTL